MLAELHDVIDGQTDVEYEIVFSNVSIFAILQQKIDEFLASTNLKFNLDLEYLESITLIKLKCIRMEVILICNEIRHFLLLVGRSSLIFKHSLSYYNPIPLV